METFSLFAIGIMKSEKLSFSYFLVKHWNTFVQHNYAASIETMPGKIESNE